MIEIEWSIFLQGAVDLALTHPAGLKTVTRASTAVNLQSCNISTFLSWGSASLACVPILVLLVGSVIVRASNNNTKTPKILRGVKVPS